MGVCRDGIANIKIETYHSNLKYSFCGIIYIKMIRRLMPGPPGGQLGFILDRMCELNFF